MDGVDPVLSDVALTQEGPGRLVIADGKARLTEARWTGPDTNVRLEGTVDLTAEGGLREARLEGEMKEPRTSGSCSSSVAVWRREASATSSCASGTARGSRSRGPDHVPGRLSPLPADPCSLDALQGTIRFSPEALKAEAIQGNLNGGP